jgi:hypothetical protein
MTQTTAQCLHSLAGENKTTKSGMIVLLIEQAARRSKRPTTPGASRTMKPGGPAALRWLTELLRDHDERATRSVTVRMTPQIEKSLDMVVSRGRSTPSAVISALIEEEHRRWLTT